MTQSAEHLDDEQVSALIDAQLPPAEAALAHAHLATCAVCTAQLAELQALVRLMVALPSLDPPRDFRLPSPPVAGALPESPRVLRLRRWYTATRVCAASLAAAFVFLSLGTVYVDSRPPVPTTSLASPSRAASSSESAQPPNAAVAVSTPATRSLAPAAPAAGAAQSASAPIRPQSPADAGDQQAAATSVRPLPPTPAPTPMPSQVGLAPRQAGQNPIIADGKSLPTDTDPAAPLRSASFSVGVLAVLTILAAILVRQRLRAASHLHVE